MAISDDPDLDGVGSEDQDQSYSRIRFRDMVAPPLLIADDGRIGTTDTWSWVLFGETDMAKGWNTVRLGDEAQLVYVVRIKGGRGYAYVSSKMCGAGTVVFPQNIVAIARGMRVPGIRLASVSDVLGYVVDKELTALKEGMRSGMKIYNSCENIDLLLPRVAAAGEHLTHLLPGEVLRVAIKGQRLLEAYAALALAVQLEGATQATMATLVLWAATARKDVVDTFLHVALARGTRSLSAFMKWAKLVSICLARTETSFAHFIKALGV